MKILPAFDDLLTREIIAAAIDVHCALGPGFLESIYEEAMAIAMSERSIRFQRQLTIRVAFRDHLVGEHRLDFLVADEVVVELKAMKTIEDVHYAITRSYLRAAGRSRALLLNFAAPTLQVKRIGAVFRSR
jgi:GxxExxY protein